MISVALTESQARAVQRVLRWLQRHEGQPAKIREILKDGRAIRALWRVEEEVSEALAREGLMRIGAEAIWKEMQEIEKKDEPK